MSTCAVSRAYVGAAAGATAAEVVITEADRAVEGAAHLWDLTAGAAINSAADW
jgi:hypothetical protein